jgi:DNA-binding MarR family transcriptional regulator
VNDTPSETPETEAAKPTTDMDETTSFSCASTWDRNELKHAKLIRLLKRMQAHGVRSLTQLLIMLETDQRGTLCPTELATLAGMDPSNISAITMRMAALGLVTRVTLPGTTLIGPTDRGQALVNDGGKRHE